MLFGWEELRRELRREEAEEREVVPLERVADRRGGHHPDVAPRRRRRDLAGGLQVELVPSPRRRRRRVRVVVVHAMRWGRRDEGGHDRLRV